MAKIIATFRQDDAQIGVQIAYRLQSDILHAIVIANTWEEVAEFIEGYDVIDYTPLWDMSGELD